MAIGVDVLDEEHDRKGRPVTPGLPVARLAGEKPEVRNQQTSFGDNRGQTQLSTGFIVAISSLHP